MNSCQDNFGILVKEAFKFSRKAAKCAKVIIIFFFAIFASLRENIIF